ncbi:Fe(3+)-hydroxamate ABC transporter permease FhuB [Aurantimonas sp. VKM B-3413]|uniref:Fe(3+)-hydroxamate ABC transporter permease FhuB n=1 Tax=Aurantimonas sp. VKM B-3413 TaxID=2779401 RepID=UPI00210343FA|nr:Fe(3+)-hydroxamate ABC transporter permease FhuB [Aurantimonas sp. VKM B-3413]
MLSLGLALFVALLAAGLLAGPVRELFASTSAGGGYDAQRMVLLYAQLPRFVMALLCGGALAASGAILQQVLRNPLASPTTLGIDAGARLALALATLFAPALFGFGRDVVALLGSGVSTLVVFALVRRKDFAAVSLVLAGLVVSLYCGALAAILVLLNDRYLVSLFIWGAGSLSQQGWQPALDLALRLALLVLPAALLVRPLSLIDLGDESGRALGLSVGRLRFLAVALSVLLAAFVASAVGVIGFVGLVAPLLARLAGARRFGERLLFSTVIGALLLALTDTAVQLAAGATAEFLPTGAVTAVFGSPLLLVLLPRLKSFARPALGARAPALPRRLPKGVLAALLLCIVVLLAAAVLFGRDAAGGWQLLPPSEWSDVLPWRVPRLAAACLAGAMLGVAGLILQRLTGNEMASPEVLGVSAGAAFAFALSLFLLGGTGIIGEAVLTTGGGMAVLAAILLLSRRSGFVPETVLLAGVALNALLDAVIGVLSASGDPRGFILVAWMGGSTHGMTLDRVLPIALSAAFLVAASALTARWLAILPLGSPQSLSLGVPLGRARLALLLLAAALTAAATPVLGPLTFVGLMAPHIVRSLGIRRPLPELAGTVMAGAAVMAVADWIARVAAFPYQLPTGLVAALVGAPVLMALIGRREVAR